MTIRSFQHWIAVLILSLVSLPAQAEKLLTLRSELNFETTLSLLKNNIESHGYTVAHVQRCDRGLIKAGHETDLYRVIFLGKLGEMRRLTKQRPELVPYLPLKIAIFAEGEHTIVSMINPSALNDFFADERLLGQFRRWEDDMRSILHEVQMARDERLLCSSRFCRASTMSFTRRSPHRGA